jgi:hypothetical protein
MNRKIIFILLLFSFGLVFLPQLKNRLDASDLLVITAKYLGQAPKGLDDPVWKGISSVHVPVQGRDSLSNEKGVVFAQSAYTEDALYFRLTWKDPTRSVVKQSWKYDGEKWNHIEGNEDRLALLFEITRINKFATRGCAITCHSPADVPRKEWKLATRSTAEKGDLWHWKAARSAPYKHADDAWLTVAGNPSGSYRETGRRKDAGKGGDIKNQTPDGAMPLYMQNPSKKPTVPGFLLVEDSVKIEDYSMFKAGDVIPFRLPLKPSGSRFDVKTESRHADGYWTLMIYRKLNTGHDDDVMFNPMKRYGFAMAVFDDSGSDHSKATKPLVLKFDK